MKTITVIMILLVGWIYSQIVSPSPRQYERLSIDNAAVLFVDHQTGLALGVKDKSENDFKSSLLALAKLAKLFDLPVVITSSRPNGPNGPFIPEVLEILDNATIIERPGEINAMDNQDFFDAVKETGRTKFIVSGIVTEVCVAFVSFSLLQEGYDVYVALDSSGTYDKYAQKIAIDRMVHAGVQPITWFAIASELQGDWRNSTGEGFSQIIQENLPWYGFLYNSWDWTLKNGGNQGNTEGENTEGGNTEGENTEGENTEGENTEGGNTEGGNTEGGANPTELNPTSNTPGSLPEGGSDTNLDTGANPPGTSMA